MAIGTSRCGALTVRGGDYLRTTRLIEVRDRGPYQPNLRFGSHLQTSTRAKVMSARPPKADINQLGEYVR